MIINIKSKGVPMLHDFLLLELYFGPPESAQYFEDTLRKYGRNALERAVKDGLIALRRVQLGPDSGRVLCSLSPKGRRAAAQNPA